MVEYYSILNNFSTNNRKPTLDRWTIGRLFEWIFCVAEHYLLL